MHATPKTAVACLASALVAAAALFSPAQALASEPTLSEAQTYEIIDQDGNVLASQNPDQEMDLASITKIMTAIVALDSGKSLDDVCPITDMHYQSAAQLAGFTSADTPTFRELMMAMLVYSGNDAADNVALSVAGSTEAFVELMNAKAAELGLTHTHFLNTHGLMEEGHYSSAADLVKLGRYALENYPFIAQAVRTRSVTITADGKSKTLESTDELMDSYAGLCGIKTGSVETGTTFLGASRRHGITLYTCVLGCETNEGRFNDTASLMDWAYDEYYRRVSLSRRRWPIRVVNWSLGFSRKVIITSEWDVQGWARPDQDIDYSTTMYDSNTLVDLGGSFGYSCWSQDGHTLSQACYSARETLYDVPSVNIFALPLFFDVSQLDS